MPNIGAKIQLETGSGSGLTAIITCGFVVNGRTIFTGKMMAGGRNDKTSYISSMAVAAEALRHGIFIKQQRESRQKFGITPHYCSLMTRPSMTLTKRSMRHAVIANVPRRSAFHSETPNDPAHYRRQRQQPASRLLGKDATGNHFHISSGALNQAYGWNATGSNTTLLNV